MASQIAEAPAGSEDEPAAGPQEGERAGAPRTGSRRTWSSAEDELLQQIVAHYGPHQWARIAQHMGSRKDWQCRERWHNHLGPQVRKGAWSAEEDEIITGAVQTMGAKWSQIKALLPGRTGHAIKNRYHSVCRQLAQLHGDPPSEALERMAEAGARRMQMQRNAQAAAAEAAASQSTGLFASSHAPPGVGAMQLQQQAHGGTHVGSHVGSGTHVGSRVVHGGCAHGQGHGHSLVMQPQPQPLGQHQAGMPLVSECMGMGHHVHQPRVGAGGFGGADSGAGATHGGCVCCYTPLAYSCQPVQPQQAQAQAQQQQQAAQCLSHGVAHAGCTYAELHGNGGALGGALNVRCGCGCAGGGSGGCCAYHAHSTPRQPPTLQPPPHGCLGYHAADATGAMLVGGGNGGCAFAPGCVPMMAAAPMMAMHASATGGLVQTAAYAHAAPTHGCAPYAPVPAPYGGALPPPLAAAAAGCCSAPVAAAAGGCCAAGCAAGRRECGTMAAAARAHQPPPLGAHAALGSTHGAAAAAAAAIAECKPGGAADGSSSPTSGSEPSATRTAACALATASAATPRALAAPQQAAAHTDVGGGNSVDKMVEMSFQGQTQQPQQPPHAHTDRELPQRGRLELPRGDGQGPPGWAASGQPVQQRAHHGGGDGDVPFCEPRRAHTQSRAPRDELPLPPPPPQPQPQPQPQLDDHAEAAEAAEQLRAGIAAALNGLHHSPNVAVDLARAARAAGDGAGAARAGGGAPSRGESARGEVRGTVCRLAAQLLVFAELPAVNVLRTQMVEGVLSELRQALLAQTPAHAAAMGESGGESGAVDAKPDEPMLPFADPPPQPARSGYHTVDGTDEPMPPFANPPPQPARAPSGRASGELVGAAHELVGADETTAADAQPSHRGNSARCRDGDALHSVTAARAGAGHRQAPASACVAQGACGVHVPAQQRQVPPTHPPQLVPIDSRDDGGDDGGERSKGGAR